MRLPLLNGKTAKSALFEGSTDLSLWFRPRSVLVVVQTASDEGSLCAMVRLRRTGRVVETTHQGTCCVPRVPSSPGAPGMVEPEALAAAVRRETAAWQAAEACIMVLDESALAFRAFALPFGGAAQVAAVVAQEFAEASPLPDGQFAFAAYPAVEAGEGRFLAGVSAAPKALCTALARSFAAEGLPLAGLYPLAGVLALAGCASFGQGSAIGQTGARRSLLAAQMGRHRLVGLAEEARLAHLFTWSVPPEEAAPPLREALCLVPAAETATQVVRLGGDGGVQAIGKSRGARGDEPADLPLCNVAPGDLAITLGKQWLTARRVQLPQFLAGELTPSDGRSFMQRMAPAAVAALCALLALACLEGWVVERRATQALRQAQQALYKGYRELMPDVPPSTPAAQMQRLLDARLGEWQVVQGRAGSRTGGLHVLNELHRVLGPSLGVTLDQMSLSGGQIKLAFTGKGFQSAEWVREALRNSPLLHNVRLRDVNRETGNERVRFEVEAEVRVANAS